MHSGRSFKCHPSLPERCDYYIFVKFGTIHLSHIRALSEKNRLFQSAKLSKCFNPLNKTCIYLAPWYLSIWNKALYCIKRLCIERRKTICRKNVIIIIIIIINHNNPQLWLNFIAFSMNMTIFVSLSWWNKIITSTTEA